MSETQVTPTEEILETPPIEVTPETPVVSTEPEPQKNARNDRFTGNSGDRRPPRKDRNGIREEEKEFKEEMIAIDRVTRVTA